MKNTQSTLAANGEVTISRGYSERMNQQFGSLVFNALAYGLFLSIFSGYGVVNLVFNRKEIRNRNQVSPFINTAVEPSRFYWYVGVFTASD